MFRQAFSASTRALRSAPRLAAVPKPFVQSQFIAPAFRLRAAQPATSRWYSDAKESDAAKAAEEPAVDGKDKKGETDALAELKKSLEAKETEAREWKVRS